jgi:hypothetical protein
MVMVDLDDTIIENLHADLKASALAHLPTAAVPAEINERATCRRWIQA